MSQKTPTDADREACAEEARGLVFDVLPGYWGEVYQKFGPDYVISVSKLIE